MKLIVHRGTHQIGGCAVEIKTANAGIIIDFGSELEPETATSLHIAGVTHGESNCDGVFFTHYHGDHIGLLNSINKNIPLYIGALSKKILLLQNERQKVYDTNRLQAMIPFVAGDPITVRDIKITPFMVDHSAFDAYMFLIEAEGKRILHTGDFRTHGFRGKGLSKVLDKYIGEVDFLICEGTVLNRSAQKSMTEHELSQQAAGLLKENKYVFVICASTNIDRIAAFSSAVPRGKYCICDDYQKKLLALVSHATAEATSAYQFPKILKYGKNLNEKMERLGFCFFVRLGNPMHKAIMEQYKDKNPLVIYSMWKGYLGDERTNDFIKDYRLETLHTSGHADYAALSMLIKKTNPKRIIPIHTEVPERLRELCGQCSILSVKDKEVIIL